MAIKETIYIYNFSHINFLMLIYTIYKMIPLFELDFYIIQK